MKKTIYVKMVVMVLLVVSIACYTANLIPKINCSDVFYSIVNYVEISAYKNVILDKVPIIDQTYNSGEGALNLENIWDLFLDKVIGFNLKKPEKILYSTLPKTRDKIKIKQKDEKKKEKVIEKDIKTKPKDIKGQNKPTTKVQVTNIAKKDFDINNLLNSRLPFSINKKKNKILIYHTHTSEGYSNKKKYGVVKAGKVLATTLKKEHNFNVIHNGTINDKDYNSSYTNAFYTAYNVLNGNKDIDLVLDIHRDAVGNGSNPLKITTSYKGKDYAQLMFVVGTDKTLKHQNWRGNFNVSIKIQQELNRLCPGITRPIYLTDKRYNQHLAKGALIVEAGGNGTDIDAVYNSMEVLAQAINNVFS